MTTTAPVTLVDVDPRTLGVRDQARADATPDDELIASVKQFGIMQPPTVTWDAEQDRHVIVIGHRRVGAAIAAGLETITVIVRDDVDDEAVKLEQQIIENERRKALTSAELAQGYKRLELFGRTPEDIAAQLAEKPERVRAGLRVAAANPVALEIIEERGLDLEQAAIIAEFEDSPSVAKELAAVAADRPENLGWKVEQERKKRANKAEKARLTEEYKAAGVTIVKAGNEHPLWWRGPDNKGRALERLFDENGNELTEKQHATCPGHAVIISDGGAWTETSAVAVCTDWKANGHADENPVKHVDPEFEARQQEWARQQQERAEAKARRDANTKVRREWIRGFLGGRLNQTAGIFDLLAEALAACIFYESLVPSHITLQLLTGGEPAHWTRETDEELAAAVKAGRWAGLRIVVAGAFATLEDFAENTMPPAVKYFERLVGWGYTLSDIDQELLDAATAAAAQDDEADQTDDVDDVDDEQEDED